MLGVLKRESWTGQPLGSSISTLEAECGFWRLVNCFCHRKTLESCKQDHDMINLEFLKDHSDCKIENGLEGASQLRENCSGTWVDFVLSVLTTIK